MTPGQLFDALLGLLFVDYDATCKHTDWIVQMRIDTESVRLELSRPDPKTSKRTQHVRVSYPKRDFKAYHLSAMTFARDLIKQTEKDFEVKCIQVPCCTCGVPLTEPCLTCFPDGDDPCQETEKK